MGFLTLEILPLIFQDIFVDNYQVPVFFLILKLIDVV